MPAQKITAYLGDDHHREEQHGDIKAGSHRKINVLPPQIIRTRGMADHAHLTDRAPGAAARVFVAMTPPNLPVNNSSRHRSTRARAPAPRTNEN